MLGELRSSSRIVCTLISDDEDLIGHLWTRDDDVHSVLSPETLLHDIEMEESEKSTAKSISERWRRFMLSDERRVVHLELLYSVFHLRVFISLDWKYSGEDIGGDLFESGDCIFGLDWT